MNLKFIEDTTDWEKVNLEAENSTFLSSVEWMKFQENFVESKKFLIYIEDFLIGNFYIQIFRRKLAKFAYSPYGPVIHWFNIPVDHSMTMEQMVEMIYKDIQEFQKDFIKKHGLNLFRIDPLLKKDYKKILHEIGYKDSLAPAQAKDVWEIDISQDVEVLRKAMSDSTRYNINKTSKSGIEVVKANTPELIKAFSDLMNETTQRKSFGNFNYEYFQKQFDELHDKGKMEIFLAKKDQNYLAGAVINYYKDTAYYTHGCSTSNRELSKLRAPYFLQWTTMNDSKVRGFKKYNMWGIIPAQSSQLTADSSQTSNPLQGVSDFKKSFGGYEINYVGAIDTYVDPVKYNLQKLLEWRAYRKDRY